MPSSILNSDDGVISGTSGLKSSGGDDGVLVFQSKGTETARINTDKQIVAAAGTASLPALTTTGDVNTGIFFPAADTIAFGEGGAEAMRIDSSGNVGIGTSSVFDANTRLELSKSGTCLQFISSTTSGGARLYFSAETTTAGVVATYTNHPLVFRTNNTERMRIDSDGNLLVGATTNQDTAGEAVGIELRGATHAIVATRSGGSALLVSRRDSNGNAVSIRRDTTEVGSISVTTTAATYNTSSDYRLKHDIQPMTGALAKVAQLKPVTYKWNADDSESQGFIAHELQEVVPECVTGEKDAVDADGNPQYQGIDTSFLVATLTAAIQELSAKNDALEARIAALEGAQA